MGILIPILVGVIGGVATALIRHYIQKHNAEEDLAPFRRQYNELMRNGDVSGPVVWSPYYSFESSKIGADMAEKAMKQRILDMPQLTFDRWLTFYNNKPEAWVIQKEQQRIFANIPYYEKTTQHEDKKGKMRDFTVFLPVFWESPEEMKKYRDWVENEYQRGNAAVFEQQRDKNMKLFVDQMQEDVQARRAQAQAEIDKLREQTRQVLQKQKKELRLSDGTVVPVEKTYQSMPIVKYDGRDVTGQTLPTTPLSDYSYRTLKSQIYIVKGNDLSHIQGRDGDLAYSPETNQAYVFNNDYWMEIR